jgi:hypothetical protein
MWVLEMNLSGKYFGKVDVPRNIVFYRGEIGARFSQLAQNIE